MLVRRAVERTKISGRFTEESGLEVELGLQLERNVDSGHTGRVVRYYRKEVHPRLKLLYSSHIVNS
jgi:hypothetical protein